MEQQTLETPSREFVAYAPDYRTGEVGEIWADDPQSLAVLDKVKQVVALINSFEGDTSGNLTDIICGIDFRNGHTAICRNIQLAAWKHFVKLQGMKRP